jgi:hypothetical protein
MTSVGIPLAFGNSFMKAVVQELGYQPEACLICMVPLFMQRLIEVHFLPRNKAHLAPKAEVS